MSEGEVAPPVFGSLGDVKTARLDLRRFYTSDVDGLSAVFAEKEVWEFPFGRAFSRAETQAFIDRQIRHWVLYSFGLWVVRQESNGRIVGYVGLSVPTFLPEILPAVEVGWRFSPSVWGLGYASEGATAALDEAFTTLGLDSVCSIPETLNRRSVRVADRLGMTMVRRVNVPANEQRGVVRCLLYEINREAWLRGRRKLGTLGG
ncbi:MAG TPA: GNAT family N-acetyltransferase [Acidimicrobiales bacterium]|nr:GNAT family N-acetyltransferase [Acidimicrobiales bacterium]